MEKHLVVTSELHGRVKAACKARKVKIQEGAKVLLEYSLDSLDSGKISLNPVTATEMEAQP